MLVRLIDSYEMSVNTTVNPPSASFAIMCFTLHSCRYSIAPRKVVRYCCQLLMKAVEVVSLSLCQAFYDIHVNAIKEIKVIVLVKSTRIK